MIIVYVQYLFTFAAACLFAELSGYFLHKLLHSDRIRFLSRNHMIHHLRLYGPDMAKRSEKYLDATVGRAGVGGIGLEWLLPVGLLIASLLGLFALLGIGPVHQLIFVGVAVGWGLVMFAYMHGSLHLKNFWMLENRFLRRWFRGVRRLHDIHHLELNDAGRMPVNFGICFFWFDRLFGTFQTDVRPLNKKGHATAREVYSFVFESDRSEQ